MKILIGSKAMASYPYWEDRKVNDVDYFTDLDIKENGVETFFHNALLEYFEEDEERTASIDELYTIKVSHIFWDVNWDKHAYDILKFQDFGNADLIPDLYDILYGIWRERYGDKKVNLNVMAADFFKNTVKRDFVHDSIHASVAYYDEPLFNVILAENEAVKVDQNKFWAMSHADQIKLVREEVYATALERLVIPSGYTYSPRTAYKWALKKTITSFSKGWFPLFVVQNLLELWSPDIDYVKKHKENLDRLIKLEEGQNG
jgi:hypothetical protein